MATTLTFTTRVSVRVHRDRPLNTRIDKKILMIFVSVVAT